MSDTTTRQPDRLNPGPIQRRRLALLLSAVAVLLALPFVHSMGAGESRLHEDLEVLGMVLIAAAIVGRSWWTLYLGGRKELEIVASGSYFASHNPLYVFSMVAFLGIGLQTGSLVLGGVAAAIGYAIVHPVIRREEEALASVLDRYKAYFAQIFGSNFALWRGMETTIVNPTRLKRTFLEALAFLLVMPIFEVIEKLQDAGYVITLLNLP